MMLPRLPAQACLAVSCRPRVQAQTMAWQSSPWSQYQSGLTAPASHAVELVRIQFACACTVLSKHAMSVMSVVRVVPLSANGLS